MRSQHETAGTLAICVAASLMTSKIGVAARPESHRLPAAPADTPARKTLPRQPERRPPHHAHTRAARHALHPHHFPRTAAAPRSSAAVVHHHAVPATRREPPAAAGRPAGAASVSRVRQSVSQPRAGHSSHATTGAAAAPAGAGSVYSTRSSTHGSGSFRLRGCTTIVDLYGRSSNEDV